MNAEIRGGLVISDRPQISVEESEGYMTISVVSIGADFKNVEIKDVQFPVDCAEEVARAILDLARN